MRDSDELRAARKALGLSEFHQRHQRARDRELIRQSREFASIQSFMAQNGAVVAHRPPRFSTPTSVPVTGAHRCWRQREPVKFKGPQWPEYAERSGARSTTRVLFNQPGEKPK